MKNDLTEVIVVLDRSGSMGYLWDDATGALNQFVKDHKQLTGECKYTLVVFDSQSTDVIHSAEDIQSVSDFPAHITPRGGTPLLDALGQTFNSFIDRYENTPDADRPGGVIFAVITDGQENASTKFKKTDIVEIIKEKTDDLDWKFLFLSSDLNAFDDAREYSFAATNTMSMSATGQAYTKGISGALNQFTSLYRTSSLNDKATMNFAEVSAQLYANDDDIKMASDVSKSKTETEEDETT